MKLFIGVVGAMSVKTGTGAILMVFSCLVGSVSQSATLYKCALSNGTALFQDRPCGQGVKKEEIITPSVKSQRKGDAPNPDVRESDEPSKMAKEDFPKRCPIKTAPKHQSSKALVVEKILMQEEMIHMSFVAPVTGRGESSEKRRKCGQIEKEHDALWQEVRATPIGNIVEVRACFIQASKQLFEEQKALGCGFM